MADIIIARNKEDKAGFTVNGKLFRTFRSIIEAETLLTVCLNGAEGKDDEYTGEFPTALVLGHENEEGDVPTGDRIVFSAGKATVTTETGTEEFAATAFAKAVVDAISRDPLNWMDSGREYKTDDESEESLYPNKSAYERCGVIMKKIRNIAE